MPDFLQNRYRYPPPPGFDPERDLPDLVRQIRATNAAIAEGIADCYLAGDRDQGDALMAQWRLNALALARAREDLGERPRLRRGTISLTARACAARAAEIYRGAAP